MNYAKKGNDKDTGWQGQVLFLPLRLLPLKTDGLYFAISPFCIILIYMKNILIFVFFLFFVLPVNLTSTDSGSHRIYKSADQGRTWLRSDAGMTDQSRINAFTALGNLFFAGTDNGIFVSHDQGESWELAYMSLEESIRILCLETLGEMLFAGTDIKGILVSADQGKSWQSLPGKIGRSKILSLRTEGKSLYAGTDEEGVFLSEDQGKNWGRLNTGIPEHAQIFDLAVISKSLFAALYSKGLYQLESGDQEWTKAGQVTPLALATIDNTVIAGHNPGGIFWSRDRGQTWQDSNQDLPLNAPVWTMAGGKTQVYAGVADGVYFSDDKGKTWERAVKGLPEKGPGVSFLVTEGIVLAGVIANP